MAAKPGKVSGAKSKPKVKAGKGAPLFAAPGSGKPSQKQSLMAGQMSTVTPGDTLGRSAGQYGKEAPGLLSGADSDPISSSGAASQFRNASGGIRSRPRAGGLTSKFQQAPETVF